MAGIDAEIDRNSIVSSNLAVARDLTIFTASSTEYILADRDLRRPS
jgi:hypothetical protein